MKVQDGDHLRMLLIKKLKARAKKEPMAHIARRAGIGKVNLYQFSVGQNKSLKFESLVGLVKALGIKMNLELRAR